MPASSFPRPEQPSTYVVEDRSNQDELRRLHLQDQMLTSQMGGVLPDQPDPAALTRILDVGCGTGGWLIEVAKIFPTIKVLVGVDASLPFVQYARAQAEANGVSDRVEFHVMDALRMLEFPHRFFDLVNQRLGQSWLRTWDWPKLLQEYQRVVRPEGIIRIVEGDLLAESSSPALLHLNRLLLQALHQSGHYFTAEWNGLTSQLVRVLRQHGVQQVQAQPFTLRYRAGTPEGQSYYENARLLFRTFAPFLKKWTRAPEEYEALYQQALSEMQQPECVADWHLLTVWGKAPYGNEKRGEFPR